MSFLKFHHVFFMLLALAAMSAFMIPPRFTDPGRAQVQGIFEPVSKPTRLVALWAKQRFFSEPSSDPRTPAVVGDENQRLRVTLANVSAQLEQLKLVNRDRELLGDVRDLCTPVAVTGSDPGGRDSLSTAGTTLQGIKPGMKVLYPGGLVGVVDRAGATGSQVRLVTDRGFKLLGRFGRFVTRNDGNVEFVRIATDPILFTGQGGGILLSSNLTTRDFQSAGIQNGDWLTLDDRDWPINLSGYKIGRVVGSATQVGSPLFIDVRVAPSRNLSELREVMVMVKN